MCHVHLTWVNSAMWEVEKGSPDETETPSPPNYIVGIAAEHPNHSKHSKSLLEQHTFCVSKAALIQNSIQIKE